MTTKTGPQKYPGASTKHWYQDDFGGDSMEVNVVVTHTTEGRTLPDYGGGAVAPNLTAVPDCAKQQLVWYQHFDIDVSSRALENRPGGVETNTLNAVQVEYVGTCDPETRNRWVKAGLAQNRDFVFWADAPDWALREVAEFLAWMHKEHGVPLVAAAPWLSYPSSYGSQRGQRMTAKEWEAFRGVCGHQHVPENDHGDPGSMNIPKAIGYAKELLEQPATGTPQPKPPAAKPTVDLSKVVSAARTDPAARQGHQTYAAGVRLVEQALDKLNYLAPGYASDGSYGTKTVAAYAAWQKHCGYSGSDADGIPGKASLARLGKDSGLFTVTS